MLMLAAFAWFVAPVGAQDEWTAAVCGGARGVDYCPGSMQGWERDGGRCRRCIGTAAAGRCGPGPGWAAVPTFSGTQDEWTAVCIVNGGEDDELACDSDGRITFINVKQAPPLACPLGLPPFRIQRFG